MNVNFLDKEIAESVSAVRSALAPREHFAYVYTFGCQQNEADSEKIRGILSALSYTIVDTAERADLIILNTCAVRRLAELKALSMLGNFKELKRQNPELLIGVCGCMAAEVGIVEQLKRSFRYVSFTAEPGMLHKLPELILRALNRERTFVFNTNNDNVLEGDEPIRSSAHRAWVSVMHGCNNFCSYCIVPYVRGRERSRKAADVIAECRGLVAHGYKEITLLGQNVNSYKAEMDFASLMREIAEIDGDFIVRFMTSHPKDVSDELIEVMAEHTDKIAPHFHLPLQSGSDAILRAMNRTYNMEKYMQTVDKLRRAVRGIAITSDVIVGFPGESDDDFRATMEAIKNIRFDMVYSFNYSKRDGTRAAEMPNQVPEELKSLRMKELLEVQAEIAHEINDAYVGGVYRVLVDSVSKRGGDDTYSARTATNKLVHFKSSSSPIGQFKRLKIDRAGAYDLFGTETNE